MSDDYLKKIKSSDSIADMVSDINQDFTVLARRIQEQNKSISLFDTIHIESNYHPTDVAQEPQTFIATKWNTMANYSGVYIDGGEEWETPFQGHIIKSGDILIKLPGNALLVIENDTETFIPNSYNIGTAIISYTKSSSASVSTNITLGLANSTYQGKVERISVGNSVEFACYSNVASTSFSLQGEPIYWSGSYCTNTIPADILDALGASTSNPVSATILYIYS